MGELPPGSLLNIGFQDPVDSFPHRKNYESLRASHNAEHSRVSQAILAGSVSATEVQDARENAAILLDRLQGGGRAVLNRVVSGLTVSALASPDMTVYIGSGEAMVAGAYCRKGVSREWARAVDVITITEKNHGFTATVSTIRVESTSSADALPTGEYTVETTPDANTFTVTGLDAGDATGTCDFGRYTGTITAPASDERYDVVCINSDNTLSVVTGTLSADPVLPQIANTQRPLAYLKLTDSTTEITSSDIVAAKQQGAVVLDGDLSRWYFDIQSAVDSLDDDMGGTIEIAPGDYYEEIDLSGKWNCLLDFKSGSTVYRVGDSSRCLKIINGSGSETENVRIVGGKFHGNGKAGATTMLYIDYCNYFSLSNLYFATNASSTATYPVFQISNAIGFRVDGTRFDGTHDYTESEIASSCLEFLEDGYHRGQVVMCGTDAEKARMLKRGWLELTAAANKFLRIQSGAAVTGGSDSAPHLHQWHQFVNGASDRVYNYEPGISQGWVGVNSSPESKGAGEFHFALTSSATSLGRDYWTDYASPDNRPAFYSLIALIHR
jgi:hypothetical protein